MDWRRRAEGNARAEIVEKLNQRDQRRPRRPQDQGPHRRPWRRADANDRRAEFGKLIADDTEKWGKVIRAANIKPA